MSQETDHDSEGPIDGTMVPSIPDGYEPVEHNVIVRSHMAEEQFRSVERILGNPPLLRERYKAWADKYAFAPATAAAVEALCTYLRDRNLAHEYDLRYRWLKPES